MNHRVVPDAHVPADDKRNVDVAMQSAVVLNIGVGADGDRRQVPPNDRTEPDAGSVPDGDVSDDGCCWRTDSA